MSNIASGTIHKLPADFRKALADSPKALAVWEDITPLARNEWDLLGYVWEESRDQRHSN